MTTITERSAAQWLELLKRARAYRHGNEPARRARLASLRRRAIQATIDAELHPLDLEGRERARTLTQRANELEFGEMAKRHLKSEAFARAAGFWWSERPDDVMPFMVSYLADVEDYPNEC
jgi:hypothetical protein